MLNSLYQHVRACGRQTHSPPKDVHVLLHWNLAMLVYVAKGIKIANQLTIK